MKGLRLLAGALAAASAAVLLAAGSAWADTISSGGTASETVAGTTSIYEVFGHAGNPGGDYGPDSPAVLLSFAAGSGNVFTFTATGVIGCCGYATNSAYTPDGAGGGMNVTGANGLSSLIGNSDIPLVGVFTSETDPSLGSAPATLTFDANNPLSLSPLLDQVFYIGDGRAGYNNGSGAQLTFTAPTTATRLYLGGIDAFGFNGLTGYYNDNAGEFDVTAHLSGGGTPEPATWAMMLLGFFGLGGMLRACKTRLA
jgi:hypothetical protein